MQKDLVSSITSLSLAQDKSKQTFAMPALNVNFSANRKNNKDKTPDYSSFPSIAQDKNRAKFNTAKNIPSYVARGLKGDPNFNFYEFMQITKIPYFLGGPGLVVTILAGKNLLDMRANKAAKFNAKGMALGCALYYIMTAIAKKCVDIPVRVARGVDLNQTYTNVVISKAENSAGQGRQKLEHHNIYESSKFVRWDLLYNKDGKTPREINSNYNKISKKMGMSDSINDSDSAVKPLIMKLIKESRAWKYIISVFAVMLGVGLGNQQSLKEEFCTGLFNDIKQNIVKFPKNIKLPKFKNITGAISTKVYKPLKSSVISLWKGSENTMLSKSMGKFAIIGFFASVLAANISIFRSTNKKRTKYVNTKEATND